MTKRFLLASILLSSSVVASADDGKRPNILFAFADDWGRCASIYAEVEGAGSTNDVVKTPNFDKVARRGVLFRNAFVNAPSCTPCRSSLLSGQYFWRTGRAAILQGAVWDSNIPSWPLMLREQGYHIGKTWKVWTPGVPSDAPYGGQKHAYHPAGGRFNRFSQVVTGLVENGKSVEEAKQDVLNDARVSFTTFLKEKGDKPFCYWFGPTNVHRRWTQGSGKKLWNLDPNDLKGKMPPFLPDVHDVREDLVDYFGEIAAFDAALGILIEELKKAGEFDNTLIVVSGDHGPPGFPHGKCNLYDYGTNVPLAIAGPGVEGGRVVDDFVNLPDLAPTLSISGGAKVPDVMTGRDLWPVLKSTKNGLVDETRSFVVTGRERHVAIAREGMLPYPQRAIRTADFLFVTNFRPDRYPLGDPYRLDSENPPTRNELVNNTFATLPDEDQGPTKAWIIQRRKESKWKPYYDHAYGKRPREELFDLKKDPHQMKNVGADPAYASQLAQLKKQLFEELTRTGDPRMENDGEFFENPPMAGPIPRDAKR